MPNSIRAVPSDPDRIPCVLVVNAERRPLFWPTLYLTRSFAIPNAAQTSIEKVGRVLGFIYDWADAKGIDLDYLLLQGNFLSVDQAEDLAHFLKLGRVTQLWRLQQAAKAAKGSGANTSMKLGKLVVKPGSVARISRREAAVRIWWAAKYIEEMLLKRLGSMSLRLTATKELKELGPMVVQRLRDQAPRTSNDGVLDETLEGLPPEVEDRIDTLLHPDHAENPFSTRFLRLRNFLIWRFVFKSTGRRNEVRNIAVRDVDYANCRLSIRVSKTRPRTVAIADDTAEVFHEFVARHWSKLPKEARKRGMLFTTQKGVWLSLDAINLMFRELRRRIPGLPGDLTPHTGRRTWNDRLSEMNDALPIDQRMSPEEEEKVRKRLNGWSAKSQMAAVYTRRSTRRKADEVAEALAQRLKPTP